MRRDRGRETSSALVEVRTVLSRAETALDNLKRHYYDEDRDEMIDALTAVVEALSWWKRTGR